MRNDTLRSVLVAFLLAGFWMAAVGSMTTSPPLNTSPEGGTLPPREEALFQSTAARTSPYTDDIFEENDGFSLAKPLNVSFAANTYYYDLNGSDPDFYLLDIYQYRTVTVKINHSTGIENLDLYVYDLNRKFIGSSTNPGSATGTYKDQVSFFTNYTGRYYFAVRVVGNPLPYYEMWVDVTTTAPVSEATEWNVWPGDNYTYTYNLHEPGYMDRRNITQAWTSSPIPQVMPGANVISGDPQLTREEDDRNFTVSLGPTLTTHDTVNTFTTQYNIPPGRMTRICNALMVNMTFAIPSIAVAARNLLCAFQMYSHPTNAWEPIGSVNLSTVHEVDFDVLLTDSAQVARVVDAETGRAFLRLNFQTDDPAANYNLTTNIDLTRVSAVYAFSEKFQVDDFIQTQSGEFRYWGLSGAKFRGNLATNRTPFSIQYNTPLDDYATTGLDPFLSQKLLAFTQSDLSSSHDRILEWYETQMNTLADSNLQVAYDATGVIHLVWQRRDWDGDAEIFYSNNSLGTFLTPVRVTNNRLDDVNPRIVAGPTAVHLVWQRYDGHDYELVYANSTVPALDGSGVIHGFENLRQEAMQLTYNSYDDGNPTIAVDSAEQVYIAFAGYRPPTVNRTANYDVMLVNSSVFYNGSVYTETYEQVGTWFVDAYNHTHARLIGNDATNEYAPVLLITPSNCIHAAWLGGLPYSQVFYANQTMWGNGTKITTPNNNSIHPYLACDNSGGEVVNLLWATNIDGDYEIFRAENDTNFGTIQQYSDNDVDDLYPTIAFDTYNFYYIYYISETIYDVDWSAAHWDQEVYLITNVNHPTSYTRTKLYNSNANSQAPHPYIVGREAYYYTNPWENGTYWTTTNATGLLVNHTDALGGYQGLGCINVTNNDTELEAGEAATYTSPDLIDATGTTKISFRVYANGTMAALERGIDLRLVDDAGAYATATGTTNVSITTRNVWINYEIYTRDLTYKGAFNWARVKNVSFVLVAGGILTENDSYMFVDSVEIGGYDFHQVVWWEAEEATGLGWYQGTALDLRMDDTPFFSTTSRQYSTAEYDIQFIDATDDSTVDVNYNRWGALTSASWSDAWDVPIFTASKSDELLMPVVTGVTINNDTDNTTTRDVKLEIRALGAEQMQVLGPGIITPTPWIPYNPEITIKIKDGAGTKNIEVRVRNGHRVSEKYLSSVYYDKQTGQGIPGYPIEWQLISLVGIAAALVGLGRHRNLWRVRRE